MSEEFVAGAINGLASLLYPPLGKLLKKIPRIESSDVSTIIDDEQDEDGKKLEWTRFEATLERFPFDVEMSELRVAESSDLDVLRSAGKRVTFQLDLPKPLFDAPVSDLSDAIGGTTGMWIAFAGVGAGGMVASALIADAAEEIAERGVRFALGVDAAAVRLPWLTPAKKVKPGRLVADESKKFVALRLGDIVARWRIDGTDGITSSIYAGSLDAEDEGVIRAVMDPPYALIGPSDVLGLEFVSGNVDISDTAAIASRPKPIQKYGLEWTGLHIEKARLFLAVDDNWVVSGGVKDLFVGFGDTPGVTGEISLSLVNADEPVIDVDVYAPGMRPVEPTNGDEYEAGSGAVAVFEITGGTPPYKVEVDPVPDGVDFTPPNPAVRWAHPIGVGETVTVKVTDKGEHEATRSVTIGQAPVPHPDDIDVQVRVVGDVEVTHRRIEVANTEVVELRAVAREDATITWTGGDDVADAPFLRTVPVPAAGARTEVTVTQDVDEEPFAVYFRHDEPPATTSVDPAGPWLRRNASLRPLTLHEPGPVGPPSPPAGERRWAIKGYASNENRPSAASRNLELSKMRAEMLAAFLKNAGHEIDAVTFVGDTESPVGGPLPPWRRATATPLDGGPTRKSTIEIEAVPRAQVVAETGVEPEPAPSRPSWVRGLGAAVKFADGDLIECRVDATVDLHEALEDGSAADLQAILPEPSANSGDGIVKLQLQMRLGSKVEGWEFVASVTAIDQDEDGLLQYERGDADSDPGLAALGSVVLAGPAIVAGASAATDETSLAPVGGLSAAAAATGILLDELGIITVQSVTLQGVGVLVGYSHQAEDPRRRVGIMADLITRFGANLWLVGTKPDKYIAIRYRSLGFELTAGDDSDAHVIAVFDPKKVDFDVPGGALDGKGFFGSILRCLNPEVTKKNPIFLEVDIALGVDLGFITVDTVRMRTELFPDPGANTSLRGFSATLDIPGVMRGKGTLVMDENSFTGALDVEIPSIGIRGAATLTVRSSDGTTGVLVGVTLTFGSPVPLGGTGLGLYGVLGGVALNHERTGTGLPWLEQRIAAGPDELPGNLIMAASGWQLSDGAHSFAAGVILGTTEGGYLVNLTGVLVIGVPGPVVSFAVMGNVLSGPPDEPKASGAFVALFEFDARTPEVLIGAAVQLKLAPLLELNARFEARFVSTPAWFAQLGTYAGPVEGKLFGGVLRGYGYLGVYGDGIDEGDLAPALAVGSPPQGLTVVTGFGVDQKLGGGNLHVRVWLDFHALISAEPERVVAALEGGGELNLFDIVTLSVTARLRLTFGDSGDGNGGARLQGEICGRIKLLFVTVKGCISADTARGQLPAVTPPPLVTAVDFVSVPVAPVLGMAGGPNGADTVTTRLDVVAGQLDAGEVPIDSVPVVRFSAPFTSSDAVFSGFEKPTGASLGAEKAINGDIQFAHRLDSVTLKSENGGDPDLDGPASSVWWAPSLPAGDADRTQTVSLALFDRTPFEHRNSIIAGSRLDEIVATTYATICEPVPAAAAQLWTFHGMDPGPSDTGWLLIGDPTDVGTGDPAPIVVTSVSGVVHPYPVSAPNPAIVTGLDSWANDPAADLARAAAVGVVPSDVLAGAAASEPFRDLADAVALTTAGLGLDPRPQPARPAVLVAAQASEPVEEDGLFGRVSFDLARLAGSSDGDAPPVHIVLTIPADPRYTIGGGQEVAGLAIEIDGEIIAGDDLDLQDVTAGQPLDASWLTSDFALRLHEVGALAWLQAQQAGPAVVGVQPGQRPARDLGPDEAGPNRLVVVRVPGGQQVDIGWQAPRRLVPGDTDAPPIIVLGVVGTARAAWVQHRFRSQDRQAREDFAQRALTSPDDDTRSLLRPGVGYQLEIVVRSQAHTRRDDGTFPEPDLDQVAPTTVTVRFVGEREAATVADPTALQRRPGPPMDIEPFVLSTEPAIAERDAFLAEPMSLTVAASYLPRLFAAYDKTLTAHILPGLGIDEARHPDLDSLEALAPLALPTSVPGYWSNFVSSLNRVVQGSCVPSERTEEQAFRYDLGAPVIPNSSYVVEIHAHDDDDDDRTGDVVFRYGFTTGAFATPEALAEVVRTAPPVDTLVSGDVAGALEQLVAHAAGDDELRVAPGTAFETFHRSIGIDLIAVGGSASVTVLWSGASGQSTPAAAIVTCPDRLIRSRPAIVEQIRLVDPLGPPDATTRTLEEETAPWLWVGSSSWSPGDQPIVADASGQRLVVPIPASREIGLALRRASREDEADAWPMLELDLDRRADWEQRW